MSTVSEVTGNIQVIVGTGAMSSKAAISGWDNPSLDCSVVTGCANLGLRRAAATSEDDGSNHI
jgi:hypothetical protein